MGPTADGGYYLVGARKPHAALFDTTQLGTNGALEALRARATELRLRVAQTETCYDIDVFGDLARLAHELAVDPLRAPRTAEYLARCSFGDAAGSNVDTQQPPADGKNSCHGP